LEQGSSVGGAKRFVLLESVRQYAEACARERNVLAKLNVRHGDYFDAFVRAQAVQLHGASEEHALALLDEEHANVELMLSSIAGQGEVERGLELAELLHWYWYRRARFSRGEYWLSLFLEGQDDARTPLRARGTRALAWMLFIRGAWRRAYSAYAESLYVSRQCGDAHCEAWSLAGVGVTARWMGDVERGTEYTEEAVRVARATGDPYLLLHTLIWAYATTGGSFTGEPPVARLQEAADVARRMGSRWSYAHVLNGLADLFSELGSYEQAESDYLLALHEFDGLGDRWMLAWTEEGLGLLSVRQEDLPRAAAHTARAVALFHELGDELNLAVVLVRLADVHEALGRAAAAARFAGAASTVMDWLANSDLARSPRIEAARERCAGYERIMPLAWAAGRDAPRHRVVEEAQAVELSEDAASAG
jgi:non-specific serine/threonine protein kinase